LDERNIDLVVFPVPVKAAIYPTALSEKDTSRPLANRSFAKFIEILEHSGIAVFDSRAVLYDFEATHGNSYLSTDTHWSPATVKMIAGKLADYLSERDSTLRGNKIYRYYRNENLGPGDLSRMLLLPDSDLYPDISLEMDQVLSANGMLWQPDKDSPVLLLGDSFTNIYSSAGLGMGVSGGLAEHLSYQLKRGVDLLARNDDGAYSSREMLAAELRRGSNRLTEKRIVVWQFSERELTFGDWKDIPLIEGTVESSDFLAVPSETSIGVEATIADISHSPRPGTIPYRDNVVTLHLVDLQGSEVKESARQALVYSLGMRDNEMTAIAGVRPGDRVSLILSSWSDVENEYGSYRRTSLADEMIELEIPNWGVLHENTTD
jgi:alginate O-acetyltransferase complex protein AlgJ